MLHVGLFILMCRGESSKNTIVFIQKWSSEAFVLTWGSSSCTVLNYSASMFNLVEWIRGWPLNCQTGSRCSMQHVHRRKKTKTTNWSCVFVTQSPAQSTQSSVRQEAVRSHSALNGLTVSLCVSASPNFLIVFTLVDIWSNLKSHNRHCTCHQSSSNRSAAECGKQGEKKKKQK